MDDADISGERIDAELAALIKRQSSAPVLAANGYCHWCDAELPMGSRFCDKECLTDWEADVKAKMISGRL